MAGKQTNNWKLLEFELVDYARSEGFRPAKNSNSDWFVNLNGYVLNLSQMAQQLSNQGVSIEVAVAKVTQ